MKNITKILVLIICLAKNSYSQTLMSNPSVICPASCTTCCDGSFTITPLGCTLGTYSIIASAPITPILTASGFEYTNVCYGVYVFTLTSNNCPSGTISYSVGFGTTTSIAEIKNYTDEVTIYPNPTSNTLNINDERSQFQNSTVEIKNQLGQLVFTAPFRNQINLSDFNAGIYFLSLVDKNSRKTIKYIKQ